MIYLLELLLVFMLIAAVIAIWTRHLLSSVIAVGAVGFASSVAFLLLRAPDVAITQIDVEVLTLVILIRATVRLNVRTETGTRDLFGTAVSAALVVMLFVFAVVTVAALPPFGQSVPERVADAPSVTFLEKGVQETGSANLVTSVLLDFRGYDTLGEATVLFASIVGATVLLRKRSKGAHQSAGNS